MRFCECGNPVFGTDKKTGIGYCKNHQWKRTDTDKRSIVQKAISKSKVNKEEAKVRSLITRDPAEAKKIYDIEKFFSDAAKELAMHPFCQECGSYIPRKYFRAATAHILPKKKEYGCPSVAAHPLNRLFLGAGCGCHNKSHRWDTFSKLKVWPEAVKKFKEFYPLIAEEERKYIPQILLNELEKPNL